MLRVRTRQKIYLGRYARQDYFVWEHRELTDMLAAFEELCAIVSEENEVARVKEDR